MRRWWLRLLTVALLAVYALTALPGTGASPARAEASAAPFQALTEAGDLIFACGEVPGPGDSFGGGIVREVFDKPLEELAWKAAEGVGRVVFDDSFAEAELVSTADWFSGMATIASVEGANRLDTSRVTDMSRMFFGCEALQSLDLSGWDVSGVADLSMMFHSCKSLRSLNLSGWNPSGADTLRLMFAMCYQLTSLDLRGWDISAATDLSSMFSSAMALSAVDLSGWKPSREANLSGMFYGCLSLQTLWADADADWSGVAASDDMFFDCANLRGRCYLGDTRCDAGRVDASLARVRDAEQEGYFTCRELLQAPVGPEAVLTDDGALRFALDRLFAPGERFGGAEVLAAYALDAQVVFNAPEERPWHRAAGEVERVVIEESFASVQPASTAWWFADFTGLRAVEGLERLDTRRVSAMDGMFYGCESLEELDITDLNVSRVLDMNAMFSGCTALRTLWCAANTDWTFRNGDDMFLGCEALVGRAYGNQTAYSDPGNALAQPCADDEAGYFTCRELSIARQPGDASASLEGGEASFNILVLGREPRYQWQTLEDGSWTDIEGATDAALTVPVDGSMEDARFRCAVSSDYSGELFSESAGVIMRQPLEIISQPSDVHMGLEGLAEFTVEVFGQDLGYQWQALEGDAWRDVDRDGADTSALSLEPGEVPNGTAFRCVITDGAGRVATSEAAALYASESAAIVVEPEDAIVDEGEEAVLAVKASGEGLRYEWQTLLNERWTRTGLNGANTDTLRFEAVEELDEHQFRCQVTDGAGSVAWSEAARLYLAGRAHILEGPRDVQAKENEMVTFEVQALGESLKYRWQTQVNGEWMDSSLSGADTDTLRFEAVEELDGREYRCVITDARGDSLTSEPATLTIALELEILEEPEGRTVALGETARFAVKAKGAGLRYQWQTLLGGDWTDTKLNGANTGELSFKAEAALNGRSFRCVITDEGGARTVSRSARLIVSGVVTIAENVQDVDATAGDEALFSVEAWGDGLSYQWQTYLNNAWQDTSLAGATTRALRFTAQPTLDGRQYRCVITDRTGAQGITNAAKLSVSEGLAIVEQPRDCEIEPGDLAMFHVRATGKNLKYQWQEQSDGQWAASLLFGANSDTMRFSASLNQNGNLYRCVVTNDEGRQAISESARLTFSEAFGLQTILITRQPEDIVAAPGDTVVFTVAASGEELSYHWQTLLDGEWVNTGMAGAFTSSLSVPVDSRLDGRQFRCEISDRDGGSVVSDSAKLTVYAGPELQAQPVDAVVAEGETAEFRVEAVGDGLRYQWQTLLNGQWTNTKLNGANTPALSFAATAELNGREFRCAISDGLSRQSVSESARLTVKGVLTILESPADVRAAEGEMARFRVRAAGENVKYRWQTLLDGEWADTRLNGASSATLSFAATAELSGREYRCVVSDGQGNEKISGTARLIVTGALTLLSNPGDLTVEAGGTAAFRVEAEGDGLKYQWQTRLKEQWTDTKLNGANTATLSFTATAELNGREYRCVIRDGQGNERASGAARLTVSGVITIVAHPASAIVVKDRQVTFTVEASGDGLRYQWQTRLNGVWTDTKLNGANTPALSFAATAELNGREYRCVVSDQSGVTVNSNAATLTVSGVVSVLSHPRDATVRQGQQAQFGVSAAGDGLKYQWQTLLDGEWRNTGLAGATTPSLSFTATAELNGRQYRCRVTDVHGRTAFSNAAKLTVNE